MGLHYNPRSSVSLAQKHSAAFLGYLEGPASLDVWDFAVFSSLTLPRKFEEEHVPLSRSSFQASWELNVRALHQSPYDLSLFPDTQIGRHQ